MTTAGSVDGGAAKKSKAWINGMGTLPAISGLQGGKGSDSVAETFGF